MKMRRIREWVIVFLNGLFIGATVFASAPVGALDLKTWQASIN